MLLKNGHSEKGHKRSRGLVQIFQKNAKFGIESFAESPMARGGEDRYFDICVQIFVSASSCLLSP